jgi:glutamate-1-semialdehyde 2,1-aminomutase
MLVDAGSGMAGIAASAGICQSVANDTLVLPLNDHERLRDVFAQYGDSLAAAIIEPLPANNGLLPQRASFLKELRALCTKHGALLIFDEVISGFRVAFGGCAELTGITPDLVTWGKIIGGGFPVGAYAGRRDLMQHIAPAGKVYQAGTLSANPVAMRAGIATLQQLLDNNIYAQLESHGALLERLLEGNSALKITRSGSIFWLNFLPDEFSHPLRTAVTLPVSATKNYAQLFHHLLARQIYFAPSPVEVCFLSSAHSEADIRQLADTLLTFQP